jgi:hypothetical protein
MDKRARTYLGRFWMNISKALRNTEINSKGVSRPSLIAILMLALIIKIFGIKISG